MAQLKVGVQLIVSLETAEPPYALFGKFVEQDDEWLTIEGTHGEDLGEIVVIPKRRIKLISVRKPKRTGWEEYDKQS